MIAECIHLCQRAGAKATFFATHQTDILNDIASDPSFELGIHPNFMQGSSHGTDPRDALEACLKFAPSSRSIRTHCLYQWTGLFHLIDNEFTQIDVDASLFLPLHGNLQPTYFFSSRNSRGIVRVPTFWEDDLFAYWQGWSWDSPVPIGSGVRVFAFHPVHVALNMADLNAYEALKTSVAGQPFQSITRDQTKLLKNAGEGTTSFLERLLGEGSARKFSTISEIADAFRGMSQCA